jgi:hypothetical protein
MATKKQNRRGVVRRIRRILNRSTGDVKWTRRGLNGTNYGDGPNRRSFRRVPLDDFLNGLEDVTRDEVAELHVLMGSDR